MAKKNKETKVAKTFYVEAHIDEFLRRHKIDHSEWFNKRFANQRMTVIHLNEQISELKEQLLLLEEDRDKLMAKFSEEVQSW